MLVLIMCLQVSELEDEKLHFEKRTAALKQQIDTQYIQLSEANIKVSTFQRDSAELTAVKEKNQILERRIADMISEDNSARLRLELEEAKRIATSLQMHVKDLERTVDEWVKRCATAEEKLSEAQHRLIDQRHSSGLTPTGPSEAQNGSREEWMHRALIAEQRLEQMGKWGPTTRPQHQSESSENHHSTRHSEHDHSETLHHRSDHHDGHQSHGDHHHEHGHGHDHHHGRGSSKSREHSVENRPVEPSSPSVPDNSGLSLSMVQGDASTVAVHHMHHESATHSNHHHHQQQHNHHHHAVPQSAKSAATLGTVETVSIPSTLRSKSPIPPPATATTAHSNLPPKHPFTSPAVVTYTSEVLFEQPQDDADADHHVCVAFDLSNFF